MPSNDINLGMHRAYHVSYDNKFLSYENEILYKSNLEKLGTSWEYCNKEIHYKYNSLGHRSCEISEITSDYFLFAGCSFTEGVALAYEDIYCDVIAKKLNKQYYNLGIGGSSPAITIKNMIAFLSFIQKPPSAIIIQWPYFHRYFTVSDGYFLTHLTPAGEGANFLDCLTKDRDVFRINAHERAYFLHYLNNINYKGIIVEMFGQTREETEEIVQSFIVPIKTRYFMSPSTIDFARDLGHPGSQTHKLYAAEILELLK